MRQSTHLVQQAGPTAGRCETHGGGTDGRMDRSVQRQRRLSAVLVVQLKASQYLEWNERLGVLHNSGIFPRTA